MTKKGAIGIYTLIILIAMIIVAAIVAAILLITTDEVRMTAYKTGKESRGQISTHATAEDLTASNGENGTLTDFELILKLTSGSDSVKLNEALLKFETSSKEAILQYRSNGTTSNDNTGYNTWNPQEIGQMVTWNLNVASGPGLGVPYLGPIDTVINIDLDGDGSFETAQVCDANPPCGPAYDGTYILFNLSSAGWYFVELTNSSGAQADISGATGIPVALLVDNSPIGTYGTVFINGTTENNYAIRSWASYLTMDVYKSPQLLNEDLDDDGLDDYVSINRTHAIVDISGYGKIPIEFDNPLTGPTTLSVSEYITGDERYGTIDISGTTTAANTIDADVTFTITPNSIYRGYYSVDYLNEGEENVQGNLGRGDIIRLHFESPEQISEGEHIKIWFIPKNGAVTLVEFNVPSVINTERVTLFP